MRSDRFNKFASLSIATALLTIFLWQKIALINTPTSVISAPRMKSYSWMSLSNWFAFHAEDVALAEKGRGKILFLGDSLTQNWSQTKVWSQYFKPLEAINFGIGGDMTQNLLWRLENGGVGNLNPEKIILADETISQELMSDFVHLSERGYEIWAREILKWMNLVS